MAERIVVVDYGSGNLHSVERAVAEAARRIGATAVIDVADDPDAVRRADRIILPGVGAFAACIEGLRRRDGLIEALEHAVLIDRRPFLGICVGMQLLAETGLEFGRHQGLGWLPGEVRPLPAAAPRSPHMGWNSVSVSGPHSVLEPIDGDDVYFAHSFHFVTENNAHQLAYAEFGERIVAAVGRDNILGVQFHPEKSQAVGLGFLGRFLEWSPA